MKIVYCPDCGEKMRDESIGWRCPKCKGFVSFIDGKFYPHIERPFVPPMTNADRIRAMNDEELAEFLERVHVDSCSACCDNLYWCLRNNAPEHVCQKHFLKWLQQPVKEDT